MTTFIDTPHWPALTVVLAAVLFGDALLSLRPRSPNAISPTTKPPNTCGCRRARWRNSA